MTIEDLYAERLGTPSDITPHMPELRRLADECEIVVEFGVRHGFSTVAFLASRCRMLVSYDLNSPTAVLPPEVAHKWGFAQADTSALETGGIPACDLLFIDTLHTAHQVREELRQAPYVRKYIVFHDTLTFGCWDEGRDVSLPPFGGIVEPILEFLAANPEWRVKSHTPECNGLTVLEKQASMVAALNDLLARVRLNPASAEDAILDVMDRLVGWCHPSARLPKPSSPPIVVFTKASGVVSGGT